MTVTVSLRTQRVKMIGSVDTQRESLNQEGRDVDMRIRRISLRFPEVEPSMDPERKLKD